MRTVEYVDRGSVLHALDPRVNLLVSVTVLSAAFLFSATIYLVAVFACALSLVALGRVWREFLPWVRVLVPFAVVSFLMWSLFSGLSLGGSESAVVAQLWIFELTERGLSQGTSMPFRIMTMMTVPIVFMMTVRNAALIKALRQLGVPYKLAFGFGLAFRLVYVFQDEIRTIREAQKSRGAILDSGSPITRIRRNLPVLVPAMVRGLESSKNLSTALDLKGFDSASQRNSIYRLEASTTDILVAVASLIALAALVLARISGYGTL
jgi:energy-coupling factor transport system permease protein